MNGYDFIDNSDVFIDNSDVVFRHIGTMACISTVTDNDV